MVTRHGQIAALLCLARRVRWSKTVSKWSMDAVLWCCGAVVQWCCGCRGEDGAVEVGVLLEAGGGGVVVVAV